MIPFSTSKNAYQQVDFLDDASTKSTNTSLDSAIGDSVNKSAYSVETISVGDPATTPPLDIISMPQIPAIVAQDLRIIGRFWSDM